MKPICYDLFSSDVVRLTKKLHAQKLQKLAEHNLKRSSACCLCAIADSGEQGLTPMELTGLCEMDKAQVARAMMELIQKGYICRDETDGRRYKQKYRLTNQGKRVADDVVTFFRRIKDVLGQGITEEDLTHFQKTLMRLYYNFETNWEENKQ